MNYYEATLRIFKHGEMNRRPDEAKIYIKAGNKGQAYTMAQEACGSPRYISPTDTAISRHRDIIRISKKKYAEKYIQGYGSFIPAPLAKMKIRILGARPYDEVREDCKAAKTATRPTDPAVTRCARRIAASLGDCILVPIPSHEGQATHTLALAEAIAAILWEKGKVSVVADALECEPHESVWERKAAGTYDGPKHYGVSAEFNYDYSKIVRNSELPAGLRLPVYLVDDVVNTGYTASSYMRLIRTDGIAAIGYTGNHE
jgi:hypothetical protein